MLVSWTFSSPSSLLLHTTTTTTTTTTFFDLEMGRFAIGFGHDPLKLSLISPHRDSFFGSSNGNLVGFFTQRRRCFAALKLVARAGLSSFFTAEIGLDTQTFPSADLSQLSRIGPVPGDISEVEAYCRIFRAAEQLHAAIMETLCNPLTGECTVSYSFPSEDLPLLEEKVVAGLGCMVALLNRGRDDVLSGRSSFMNSFLGEDENIADGKLPPLAIFRGEMKRCCKNLHNALENYLTPFDDRTSDIWRKLQRLKNGCYDAGFPRGEDYPYQTIFANWTPVYLSTNKEDELSKDCEVAFWSGGQVTEEGLKWLIGKGYKTIVDLREEIVKDEYYQAAVEDAVSCGKIEVIKLPVKVKTAPSMEQVEEFASLVSNSNKNPLYLHSEEGVWRTSAMVSRWRQYTVRSASHLVPHHLVKDNGMPLKDIKGRGNGHLCSQDLIPSKIQGDTLSKDENVSPPMVLDTTNGFDEAFRKQGYVNLGNKHLSGDMVYNFVSCQDNGLIHGRDGFEVGYSGNVSREINLLKAQFPTCDVFSKREMSKFFRSRKISPLTFFDFQRKRFGTLPVSGEMSTMTVRNSATYGDIQISGLVQLRDTNGTFSGKDLISKPNGSFVSNGKCVSDDGPVSLGSSVNGFERERDTGTKEKISSSVSGNLKEKILSSAMGTEKQNNVKDSASSVDNALEIVEGNMCASTTGVVRVQSRRKAEMYLVRTDGFSCTREKVTESSLAFTHPSTQQQMLMWKSQPKTVLLLKKLGPELMEEAKEVASFLYYQEKMNVLVEPDVHDIFARIPGFGFVQTFYIQDTSDLHERVDLVACLGGDGVILHASNIFRGAVPPVVSFNLGSLGFLASHNFEDYRKDLRAVIYGNNTLDGVYITLRMRLRCEIFRNGKAMPGKIFDVLNEIVVDRGSNPYLSKIECYEHNHLITKVQGDGVIIATPTGSTAYSTAAGGSMVHPNVPCMLFTPICPHSLSFRPVILPDSAQLELKIPEDARSNAWVSFDGKRRQQLSTGDSVRIAMSQHPLPTVNKSDQTGDWFHSLIRCLNWNERLDQKAL
eukprot:TRINITY_DN20411_c0_g1_i1.p1 TRINITY_DN20411_c0_g1~~TRINITY_DN20411_c0_g1_i1.p1  ORF type:complete len:1049 (+),score=211.20 TRINITY_DN20411_c0_g1_i1:83-3229(+)